MIMPTNHSLNIRDPSPQRCAAYRRGIIRESALHRRTSLEEGDSASEERACSTDAERSRQVGDLFMSLIHTCELNGANPFDYLTELQRHAEELKRSPSEWMPWNYRETLARLATPAAA